MKLLFTSEFSSFWKDAHRVFLLLVLFGTRLPVADKVVQRAVLYKCGEDKDEADRHKQVHGGHIGNFREGFPGDSTQCGHGQHSRDAWWEDRDGQRTQDKMRTNQLFALLRTTRCSVSVQRLLELLPTTQRCVLCSLLHCV